jgi:hypothetical protein
LAHPLTVGVAELIHVAELILNLYCCEAYFEGSAHLEQILFEVGSELERIERDALRNCYSLSNFDIPASVTIIEESSFEGCMGLESCLIPEDSSLVTIGGQAFAKCTSLRSFSIPRQVVEIGTTVSTNVIICTDSHFGHQNQ